MNNYYNPYLNGMYGRYMTPNSNYFRGYNNPLQIQAQMEYERMMKESHQNIVNSLIKSSGAYLGNSEEETKEVLDSYAPKPQEVMIEEYNKNRELMQYERLAQLTKQVPLNAPIYIEQTIMKVNIESNKIKSEFPDDLSAVDYFSKASSLVREAILDEDLKKRKEGIDKLYNSSQYKQLIQFRSANKVNSIDDLEIKLPSQLANSEYQERRKKFLDNILNKR